MQLEWNPDRGRLTVVREEDDKPIYKESTFWYNLVKRLRQEGHDVIRKCPAKDQLFSHMTDMPYYVRSRKYKEGVKSFYIWDGATAIRRSDEEYRRLGKLELFIEYEIFDKETA